MSEELTNATRIAALEEQVRQLTAERDEYRDSLAVTTTDNNATFDGINAALDAAGITFLDENTYAACIGRLAAQRDERNAYAERLLAENVRLSNEAATERERCGVLEREVKSTRMLYANTNSHYTDTLRWVMQQAMKATDTSHALDAAKFVGGGQ